MKDTALVTVAIGEPYLSKWRKYCMPSWQAYARQHGMDVICMEESLDVSDQGKRRSPAWQKCLVLSQAFAKDYRQVVLLDSDIVINVASAPNITDGVPLHLVGGVLSGSQIPEDLRVIMLERTRGRSFPYVRGLAHWEEDQQLFYQTRGFSPCSAGIIQTGVLVTSPLHHRELFLGVYSNGSDEEDRAYEQIALSHEILRRDLFHPLDTRFNSLFYETMLVYYPYLLDRTTPAFEPLVKWATGVQFRNSFFLHFAYDNDFIQFLFNERPVQPANR